MKLRQFVTAYWPLLGLILVELFLISANYVHGTFLIGWDNIMPEFNFLENFRRSVWGVWQEYRGLGLYDGMSHIANLPHTILLWTLSLLLPQNTLRYAFTFLMHFLGGVGAYLVVKKLLSKEVHAKPIAFVGSLFYLLNPATIQMFYTPLEAFSVHFAALPWLALTLIRIIETNSRKALLWFAFISFLTTPQFFVTTLSLPVVLLLGVISITYLTIDSKRYWKPIVWAAITFLLINAFWLLPYVAGLPGNAPVIANAKINLMSTDEVFRRNQAFGDLKNVLLLHGFGLDFTDLTPGGTFGFMLSPWRIWWNSPTETVISGILILLTLIGLFTSLHRRKTAAFGLIWLTAFILLANNTPVVKEFTIFMQRNIPFFTEAFRFPFTKFSVLFAFAYSVLLAYGLNSILDLFPDHKHVFKNILTIGLGVCVIGQAVPAFRGSFLYPNLRLQLPNEYQQLFARMATLDPSGRTAYLPQPDFWSWKQYRFGSRGSGFVWYGLQQPLMDRAFDPWSNYNENYYWELSRALYSKDTQALAAVFSKYDIRYIILDENLISQSNDRALFNQETEDLFARMPEITSLNSFNKLKLYEYTPLTSQSFVRITGALPAVTPTYSWTDNDVAFQTVGDYTNQKMNSIYYPFRELFTKRTPTEKTFTVQETQNDLTISDINHTTTITIPKETNLRYTATTHNDLLANNITRCGLLKTGPATGNVGNGEFLRFTSNDQRGCLYFGIPNLTHQEGYLIAVKSRHVSGRPLMLSLINQTAKHIETEIYLPGTSDWTTSYLVLPPLTSDGLGYTVYLANDAIGSQDSVNDIASISFYEIPYQQMVHISSGSGTAERTVSEHTILVTHPNPAYYHVAIKPQAGTRTLILNQAYHWGWKAFYIQPSNSQLGNWFHLTFPFVFGNEINAHVMVNNWANGWVLPADNVSGSSVVIFFMPQLLEWLGIILLPLPLLVIFVLRPNQQKEATVG
jgi:hypothetical protein